MVKLNVTPPVMVAHRGYSGKYPENTLLAYQAAYDCGAIYMELDLQLTNDLHPVLHHDASLERMTGVDIDVRDISLEQFLSYSPSYPSRFDQQYADNAFTSFKEYCEWLALHPEVTTFVEIKQESIDRVGAPQFLDVVCADIRRAKVEDQCVIISFNYDCLQYTRNISSLRIGWVLPEWNDQNRALALELGGDFLFCDKESLPQDNKDIWQGQWQWAVYNLDDVDSAITMANRGFAFLETNEIGLLLKDHQLS